MHLGANLQTLLKRILLSMLGSATAMLVLAQANNYPNGSLVADFTVTDTHGNTHNLYTYTSQGKHVILDFFFDTCPPCQATSHYFSELYQTYGCNGGDIICIAMNNGTDTNAEVDAYEATYGGNFSHPPAIGIEGGCTPVDNAFGVNAYPTYCLIGPDNLMKNQDIWPINDMSTFVQAFPTGSGIDAMACLVGVSETAPTTFSLAPSLTNGIVEVRFAEPTTTAIVNVTDLLGHTVQSTSVNGASRMSIDLSAFADGAYLISLVENGQSSAPQRVVLAR